MFGGNLFATLLVMAAIPVLIFSLAFRFLRPYERRGAPRDADRQLSDRVTALEEQCARLALENERLAEGQQFTQALLASRAASSQPAGQRSTT